MIILQSLKKTVIKLEQQRKALANAEKLGFNTGFFAAHPLLKGEIFQFILLILF